VGLSCFKVSDIYSYWVTHDYYSHPQRRFFSVNINSVTLFQAALQKYVHSTVALRV